jgi:hypothetical protein
MKPEDYENQARATGAQLAAGRRVGVIGSTSFWGKDSEEICEKAGRLLACVEEIVLLTGGMTGVAEVVGRSFCRARQLAGLAPSLYHILPNGVPAGILEKPCSLVPHIRNGARSLVDWHPFM